MKARYSLFLPLVLLFPMLFWGCGYHKLASDEIDRNRLFAEILKRSDRRDLGSDQFFDRQLSGSPYPEVREWCAIALGRIGSPRTLPSLYAALKSSYVSVRAAAAFAVGEIEDRQILQQESRPADPTALTELVRLLDDSALSVQMRAVEALGKTGGEREASAIIKRIESFRDEGTPLHYYYLDLAITALMRINARQALPVLTELAGAGAPEVQWRVANALYRMRLKEARPVFLSLLRSPDPNVRAHAARGLGICGDASLAQELIPLVGMSNPLSVRACALQALGNLKNPESVPAIVAVIEGEALDDDHPDEQNFAIQAANALGNIGALQALPGLRRLLHIPGPVADAAVIALARICKNQSEVFFSTVAGIPFASPSSRRAWATALGELSGPDAIMTLKRMLVQAAENSTTSSDLMAIPAVLTALAKTDDPGLGGVLDAYLASQDGVILRAAIDAYLQHAGTKASYATVLSAFSGIAASGDVEAKTYLLDRLQPWIHEDAVKAQVRPALSDGLRNVRIEAAKLLRMAGEENVPVDPGPSESMASDNTYAFLAGVRKDRSVAVIETSKGFVEIELFREDAPLTVENFASLARHGFFDGLNFMRVVPYFVVQGGDPRNDQEGGPGYTIRCEINMRPFERGSLGMALSGKDTGGSQFFITLAPQPHLDGGYTCFGRVISGMQVVDHLVAGDRIKKITMVEARTALDFRQF